MGVSSEVATAVSEKAVLGKPTKIKILVKKPGLCLYSNQVAEVNDLRNKHVAVGMKRKPEELLECQKGKRLRMDRKATSHCLNIITKLMRNKFSKPFLEPVDPVKWGIPDYFDIIKHPMDLGTIKRKLHRNAYVRSEEFEDDVRLTFSNAMLYNPPNNWVHQYAKMLNREFDGLWKSVKAILFRDEQNINKSSDNHGLQSNSSCVDGFPENGRLHKESGSKDPEKLSDSVPCSDLNGLKDDNVKDSMRSRCNPDSAGPVSHGDKVRPFCSVGPVSHRAKESGRPVYAKVIHENANGDQVCVKESDAVKVKNTSTLQQSKSDQDSEGAVSCVDEEHACESIPATAGSLGTATINLEAVLDIQLSPSKALRAAKLRSRFADTIIKAQNKLQPVKGGGCDVTCLQEEKERLERKQQEEKARIEAQVRAAELAARMKAKGELKKKREQARASLEKMERSTDLDDNFHVLKELEALIGSSLLVVRHNSRSCRELERLGLYIKAEYRVGDDDYDDLPQQVRDVEEGEFIY